MGARGIKLRAMALSSFLTALGGTFYAQYFAYIDPTITFGPSVSIQGLLQAIVGGAGTVLGPLVGAFVLTPVSELSRAAIRGRVSAVHGRDAGSVMTVTFVLAGLKALLEHHIALNLIGRHVGCEQSVAAQRPALTAIA